MSLTFHIFVGNADGSLLFDKEALYDVCLNYLGSSSIGGVTPYVSQSVRFAISSSLL